ncbi:MAG: hypothetical protein FK733_03795 [Asgard group archaeon]|nr:hypothetical protein [Asgard group archaeon]
MDHIDYEAEYKEIVKVLEEHGGELDYKTLNEILANKFEGVRLRLKTMKEKGIVDFEGIVPSFNSKIQLTK